MKALVKAQIEADRATRFRPSHHSTGWDREYAWAPVSGSNRMAVYRNGAQVGVYSPLGEVYRLLTAEGSLSDPVPAPWGDRRLPVLKTPPAGVLDPENSPMDFPPWVPYALGGGVGVMLLVLLLSQLVRP